MYLPFDKFEEMETRLAGQAAQINEAEGTIKSRAAEMAELEATKNTLGREVEELTAALGEKEEQLKNKENKINCLSDDLKV